MKNLKNGQDVTELWKEHKLFETEEFEESNKYSKSLDDWCEAFIKLTIGEIKDPELKATMVKDIIDSLEDLFIGGYHIPIRYPTTVTSLSKGTSTYYEHNFFPGSELIGPWFKWNDEKKTAEIDEPALSEWLHKK